jgi:hypothetical protein
MMLIRSVERQVVTGLFVLLAAALVSAEKAVLQDNSTIDTTSLPLNVEKAVINSTTGAVDNKQSVSSDNGTNEGRGARKGKNLLEWIGFGTGSDTDPYLARANSACLDGDMSECFKSRALASLDDFFDKDRYILTEDASVVRMPEPHLRKIQQEPFEFSSAPRAEEAEWDQFVKFLLRKVERFVKSTAVEVQFPKEVTEGGRYSPRFIDEIATEIDIIEDKNESSFCEY